MGRSVEGPAPGGSREYIPEAFDNAEDPDPIVMTLADPTEAQKRKLQIMQTALEFNGGELVRDPDGSPIINITLEAMAKFQRAAVIGHVTKVVNYQVRGVEITTGHLLAEHGETELLAEVALEITTGMSLSVGEKKT